MDVSSRGPEHFQLFSYLTQSGVRSWLEVASRVHHPFLLTDGVFGEPEQLLTGVGGIRTVWSGTAAHVSSLEHNSNAKFPVIDVQSDNFKELWPALLLGIKSSSFIALDTELSGLGNRKSLLAESIEDRYKAICHAARSRSILSLGIACYKKLEQKASDTYLVQVYNLTLLCSEEYIIEPQSVQFLVQHGFDFNKQYSIGIPYFKGNNKGGSDDRGVHIRALFTELLRAKKPLVLHNGLIDMAFLYQSFYAHLPERLATFTADLSEMFPAGIYDTKYVCEFELRLTASYLEYAYKKCKLETSRSVALDQKVTRVHVEFCQYAAHMSDYVDYRVCPEVSSTAGETDLCQQFSAFGWCPNGSQCPLSHDTDLIILQDEKGLKDKRRKRKRQREKKADGNKAAEDSMFDAAPGNKVAHMMDETTEDDRQKPETLHGSDGESRRNVGESNGDEDKTSLVAPAESKSDDGRAERASKVVNTGTHRAGFDAFMTGYIFAYTCTLDKKAEEQPEGEGSWLPTCLNKVYLSGKAAPLNVVKSTFARSSKAHVQKMEMVWGQRV